MYYSDLGRFPTALPPITNTGGEGSVTGPMPPAYASQVPGGSTAWGVPPPTTPTTTTKPKESKGFWDVIGDALKGGAAAYGAAAGQRGQPGVQYMPPQRSPIERYLPWIVVGGAAIAVAVILKKKK
jgi:hypothetical protein